jgi:mono/diheme cytochrome c family protein
MTQQGRFVHFTGFVIILVLLFLFTACGGGNDSAGTTASTSADSNSQTAASNNTEANGVATMPAPANNFTAVGQENVLTTTVALTQTQTTTTTANTANLELGQRAYAKNKCADCHGAKGEGVTGKGKAIAGTTISLQNFDQVLRTGGGQGNSHIFGRSAVSPTGMEALYAYVQSLK